MSIAYQVLNEITIRSSALHDNYQYFAKSHPEAAIAPVIKANAYGHGLTLIGDWIIHNLPPVPFVCVDSLYEAYELTNNRFSLDCLILGYTNPANYQVNKKLPYIFGISDLVSLEALGKYQPRARIHLELNTGMSRLGFDRSQLPEVISTLTRYPSLRVEGVYSHFSSADDPRQQVFTQQQSQNFMQYVDYLTDAGLNFRYRHISATAGSEIIHNPYYNLIRLGLGLYGYSPFGPRTTAGIRQRRFLKPALTLTSHIAHLKTLPAGSSIGYGRTYQSKQIESVATLPLGYHEGIDRSLSNRGFVTINQTKCPIVGQVSMNMTTIKIPRNHQLDLNDPVTIISSNPQSANSVYNLAKNLDTIPYTVLTRLHSTIRRRII